MTDDIPHWQMQAMAEVAGRWGLPVAEAEQFLEDEGVFD